MNAYLPVINTMSLLISFKYKQEPIGFKFPLREKDFPCGGHRNTRRGIPGIILLASCRTHLLFYKKINPHNNKRH